METAAIETVHAAVDYAATDSLSKSVAERQPRTITLAHDFGLLKPDDRATHVFQITNDTRTTWTIDRITRNCNCAVAKMSAKCVRPGLTEEATLAYRAPSRLNDDHRVVDIIFKEVDSPVVRLDVTASIRPAVALNCDVVRLSCLIKEPVAAATAEVRNYSDCDWRQIIASSDAPWLSATAKLLRTQTEANAARQVWGLAMATDARGLKPGHYSADLRLDCVGVAKDGSEKNYRAQLPVSMHVTGPIQLIPERMFFGKFDDQGDATCLILVRCLTCSPDFVAEHLVIRHDMKDWLRVEVVRDSSSRLQIRGVLSLPKAVETAKGSIELSLDDLVMHLPVDAVR